MTQKRIVFQGEPGANSHLAIHQAYPDSEAVPCPTFEDAFAAITAGDGPLYHHIGLYAYRRAALKRFVGLPPSALELREQLEQLRALESGMRIDVAIVASVPLGVDTPAELERVRALLARPLT